MSTPGITLNIFGRSEVGKKRSKNEDAFVVSDLSNTSPIAPITSPVSFQVSDRGILAAVSDGMGGAHAGEVASALVLSHLEGGMSTIRASRPETALRVSVEAANQTVFNAAQETGRQGMGATLTAVLFHGIYAYVAEIGDSRAYLVRANRIVQLTRDQSYVQVLIDAGALSPEESETSPLKNVILQAMGLKPNIDVALNRISIRRQDRFLVCSDGLSGTLKGQDIVNIILNGTSLDSTCAKLIETAVEHGSTDDTTVILAEVDGEGAPALTAAERLSLETATVFDPT